MHLAILTVFLVGVSLAAPTVSQEEIQTVKQNIQAMVAVLKDDTKTPAEKQAAFTNTISNLPAQFKELYNTIVEKVKAAVNNIQSPAAKSAAQQFIQLFESGSLFSGSIDQIKEQAKQIFGSLTEADKNELKTSLKQVGGELKESFKDLIPAHGN